MTEQQIRTAVKLYIHHLTYMSPCGEPELAPTHLRREPPTYRAMRHVLHTCKQIELALDIGKLEEARQQLGFVQGVLWTFGVYSIDELRSHK